MIRVIKRNLSITCYIHVSTSPYELKEGDILMFISKFDWLIDSWIVLTRMGIMITHADPDYMNYWE